MPKSISHLTWTVKTAEVRVTTPKGKLVGILTWTEDHKDRLTIEDVGVHHKYRRQGIATKMLRLAELHTGHTISHSKSRTKLGRKWSKTTGNPRPKVLDRCDPTDILSDYT